MRALYLALLLPTLAISTPIVHVTNNNITYHGISRDGVDQYLNIRFAEDTSGANRFAQPVPYLPPPGSVVNATSPGPACPQQTERIVPMMGDVQYQSEDCLNLRVARPAATELEDGEGKRKGWPVMVYIYGGGSILGHVYDRFLDPVGLIQQSVRNGEPVVYVAINYRLGVFGFAAAEPLKRDRAENNGLRDVVLALKWVRDHIAAFGGDPENVTVFGQSFGSIAIGLLLVAWGGHGEQLFHKAIMASGSVARDRSDRFAKDNTAAVAEEVGCLSEQGIVDDEALSCLKNAPIAELAKANLDVANRVSPLYGFASFSPCIDDDLLPDQPQHLLQQGRFHKNIPLIITWTYDEWSLAIPPTLSTPSSILTLFSRRLPSYTPTIGQQILSLFPVSDFAARASAYNVSPEYFRAAHIVSDFDPICPNLDLLQILYKFGNRDVWAAELNQSRMLGFWKEMGVPWGVCHTSDIPFFFNEEVVAPGDNGEGAMRLAGEYAGSFVRFANTGDPGWKGPSEGSRTLGKWPRAQPDGDFGLDVLVIGGPYVTGPVRTAPRGGSCDTRVPAVFEEGKCEAAGERVLETEKGELRKKDHGQHLATLRMAAFQRERLVERCKYLTSLQRI